RLKLVNDFTLFYIIIYFRFVNIYFLLFSFVFVFCLFSLFFSFLVFIKFQTKTFKLIHVKYNWITDIYIRIFSPLLELVVMFYNLIAILTFKLKIIYI